MVAGFLRATLEGWSRAIADPEENSQLTLLYDSNLSAQHEQDVLESSLPLIHTGADHIGWMKQGDWDDMVNMLLNEEIISNGISPDGLYTIDFLEGIYGR